METKKDGNNSPEVIVIDCNDDVPQKKKKHGHRKKCQHKRRKLESHNKTDLKITQHVKITREVFSCIINLNTNITECKDKHKCRRKHRKEHNTKHSVIGDKEKLPSVCREQKQEYYIERIVPTCGRSQCQRYTDKKTKLHRGRERNYKYHHGYHHHRSYRRTTEYHKKNKTDSRQPLQSAHKHRGNRSILSPISSSPFNDEVISLSPENPTSSLYEDVSLDSFRYSDNELDTLIKRTKERERNALKASNYVIPTKYTSKPHTDHEPISSDEEMDTVFSGTMDISIHSLATVVLEPQTKRYSSLSPKHCWTGVELQPTSGYVYQKHQNIVQCANAASKSSLTQLENNNAGYFPNDSHGTVDQEINYIKCPGLKIENRCCADQDIDDIKLPDLEIDNRKSDYNFSGVFPIKMEMSYSPIRDTDLTTKQSYLDCNIKQEYTPHTAISNYSTSCLAINNSDCCNIPEYYQINLENTVNTDRNLASGML